MKSAIAASTLIVASGFAAAQNVQLEVTVENLAPANGVTFAPLRVGFHNGTFDAFNNGESAFLLGQPDIASAPIVSIAEGGSGSTWFPAFAAADPTATLGTVVSNPAGPLTPGASASAVFDINSDINQFFTFAAMVVPSNDLFIGNDDPQGLRLLDDDGNLLIEEIIQTGGQVWDAGSEVANAANAAFVIGGTNSQRIDENGVVSFELDELATFDGLETPAGYFYDNSLISPSSEIYRISFRVVPTAPSFAAFGLAGLVVTRRRR